MVEAGRTDYRDVLMTISLLHHTARRVGAAPEKLFREAAAVADKDTAALLAGFIRRPARDKDLRASWGREEVETEGGVGFIGWEFEPYEPTYDLKRVAVEVARLVAADKYGPVSASVAAKLWPVWLQGADDAALERALGKARAGASVTGHLRPGEHPQHESQQFTVFLVELSDEASARTLLDLSRGRPPSDVASLGLAEGRLFCLVIARAFAEGARPFETAASLRRFSAGLSDILRRHTKP